MSNTTVRIIVGVIGIPVFLFLIIWGGLPFFILITLITCISLWELHNLFLKKEINTFLALDLILAVIALVVCFFLPVFINLLYLIPVIILIIELFRKNKNILNPIVSISGQFYITLPFILLNTIEKYFSRPIVFIKIGPPQSEVMNYVLIVFILIWTCDTMSYFGGMLMGKHKLTEISPKKTIEGFISGIIFTVIAALIIMYFNTDLLNLSDAIAFGLIVSLIGPAGDIFESFIKRSVDIKDSSNIIPGHGGVLDRFDSLLFVIPFIYIYLYFFVFKYFTLLT